MQILVGFVAPSAGRVRVAGEDVSREPGKTRVRRHLGYLPQNPGMYPELTPEQFLEYMAVLKEMRDRRVRRQAVAKALGATGLTDLADRRIRHLERIVILGTHIVE